MMVRKWKQPLNKPFYTTEDVLGLKPIPNVIISIGERGVGKSLGWKLQGLYGALNGEGRTIYLRRFNREIKDAKDNFLTDLTTGDPRLKNHNIIIKGDSVYIDEIRAISFYSITGAMKSRSVVFSDVHRIIFDEFLTLDKTLSSYGYDEIMLFTDFLDTVFRVRENVQIVLLANAISTTSQYFEIFGFDKPINLKRRYQHPNPKLVQDHKHVVMEIINNEPYREIKRDSKLMSIMSDGKYKRYAIENEFAFENTDNIVNPRDIRGHQRHLYSIITRDMTLTLSSYNSEKQEFIISDIKINERVPIFTFDKELIITGAMFISSSSQVAQQLQSMIMSKRLFYSSMKVKKEFLENIKKIVRTYF